MKIPLGWLRDYVNLDGIGVPELVERLTLAGLEVASVRCLGVPIPEGLRVKSDEVGPVWAPDKVVLGRIVSVAQHPNADRLTLPTVDVGGGKSMTLVTGAPNIKVGDSGQKVVVALTGAVLFDGHAETKVLKELKPGKIRGVPSDGMVCSAYELGISDEHEGIILLGADAPEPGTPAADYLGEIVLDVDVLPNMARCLAMIGVAREVATLFGRPLKLPAVPSADAGKGPAAQGLVLVAIADPALSPRYAAGVLREVTVGPSPDWLRWRLTYAGMRPINAIVDVTNYVMLEWGQPLHAFDYDKLKGRAGGQAPAITVRPAQAGEVLVTLDGVKRELTPDNLVIADSAGAVALAGVMGGGDTEVSAQTKNVLLESANFDFLSVRRTMKALNLPSEASQRFSKGLHPETVRPAAERAADLVRQYAGATVCRGLVDCYPAPLPPQVVELPLKEVRRQLGMDVPVAEATRILQALEFQVEPAGADVLRVTVPPHRRDVQAGAADLVEELARVLGYDRMPATLLADALPEQHANRPLELEENLRDLLTECGLQEVITYALTEPARDLEVGLGEGEYVRLLNPISSERVVMRHGLLGGVLEVAAANLKHEADVRLFEIGSAYLLKPGQKLPEEPRRLAIVLTGRRQPDYWGDGTAAAPPLDFFDLKGVLEALVDGLHLPGVAYRRPEKPDKTPHLHPGLSAELVVGARPAGAFGRLHPQFADRFGLAGRAVLACELDLGVIQAAVPDRFTYTPVPRFPPALRDVAVIVDETATAERVAAEIRAAGGELLRQARLFDLYVGDAVPKGKKSLAYALTYQSAERTLTDKEVDKAHKRIEDRLQHVLKAQIRGKE